MVILETRDLKKQYGTGETAVHALAGVNLSVENGEFVAVVGTSGSGKSTLLHMLGGLDRATSGKVYVDGKDIFALKDEELTIFRRRKIGFVFQSFNLVPVLSVYENIVLPLQLDGKTVDNAFIGELSKTEQKLLALLVQHAGMTVPRETLMDRIWTDGAVYVDENALSVAIKRLRDKLQAKEQIRTVYGIGYVWEV